MVRLKSAGKLITDLGGVRFQFLYGTIKIVFIHSVHFSSAEFQFLYGTIKIQKEEKGYQAQGNVSIPIWYD